MTAQMLKAAILTFVLAIVAFASWHPSTHAAPPPGESAPVGSEGPLVSTAITEQTLAGFERAIAGEAVISAYLANDVVLTLGYSGQQIRGRDAVIAEIDQLMHTAFAGQMTVTSQIVSGGNAVTTGMFSGAHIGRFKQMAATGNSIRVPFTAFYEVADCQIVSLRLDFSAAAILRQLAAPALDSDDFPNRSGEPF